MTNYPGRHLPRKPAASTSASKKKRGGNRSSNDEDEDDVDSDDGKDDKESDYIPQTVEAVNISSKGKVFGESAEVIANHKQAFMEKHSYTKCQSISVAIPTCRPKSELDYITYVVTNWQVGVKVRDMDIGHDRKALI